jgi:cellulose synthase/poly-beta-1,6-N-acetylglucosamine synthase-like glycosyltransferase
MTGGVPRRTASGDSAVDEPAQRAPIPWGTDSRVASERRPPNERRTRKRGRNGQRHRTDRHLVRALSRGQRMVLVALMLAWAASAAWGWVWWLQPRHASSTGAMAINTGLLSIEFLVFPMWFYWWLWRLRRPDSRLEVPELRVAIVVTKAPSEPWEVVRETLDAMLSQDFPKSYDVWLADEKITPETRSWCLARGVRLSSREGRADYHRPDWPRQTRCKEGNLAFFYDHWGYEMYDVVAQLDADHVPEPDYLRRMVAPFRDPHVGYVAAPSICDRNARHSWSARGRLYWEAILHGPLQAGHSGGYAPSCIGSHYAVRTSALDEIGGLGPELAEDFTTTLIMNSHGWQGVFAIDAEAHGYGPDCFADCMMQEFQWSRSMMNVLLHAGRPYFRSLTWRAKVQLGFCQIWYPMFGLLMLASFALPIVAIAARTPFARVGLGDFYLHTGPSMAILLITVLWLRRLGWLRPRAIPVISWETVLFQLVKWPWVLYGCVASVIGQIRGRQISIAVTPKGRTGVAPLPLRWLVPTLALALASASPFLIGLDGGPANGYRILALINVILYLTAAGAIIGLHIIEHPRQLRLKALRSVAPGLAITATLSAAIAIGGFGRDLTRLPDHYGMIAAVLTNLNEACTALARGVGASYSVVVSTILAGLILGWTLTDVACRFRINRSRGYA